MTYEKHIREQKKALEKLLKDCQSALGTPPNVIAQNKALVLSGIIEKAIMMCNEAIQAANLQPAEVEDLLNRYAELSERYGTNPGLDEVDALGLEVERLTKAVDVLDALRKRRQLSHRLIGHDPRLLAPWSQWIRTLESYKINQDITPKHREKLLQDIEGWRSLLAGSKGKKDAMPFPVSDSVSK